MTRRERLEAKADRRREWAGKAQARSSSRFGAAAAVADNIPLGQPILVGHHSERRARRDVERIRSNMDKGCQELQLSEHHAEKADGIERQLDRTIFSDDEDAIEAIRAKIAKLEAERQTIKDLNARCRKKDPMAIAEVRKRHPHGASMGDPPEKGVPAYALRNLGSEVRRLQARIVEIERRATQAATAEAAGGVHVRRHPLPSSTDVWLQITFAEKPDRAILMALRGAGFRWSSGHWAGAESKLPEVVAKLIAEEREP